MPNIPRLEILKGKRRSNIKQDNNFSGVIYGKIILNLAVWENQLDVSVAEFWKTDKPEKSGFSLN